LSERLLTGNRIRRNFVLVTCVYSNPSIGTFSLGDAVLEGCSVVLRREGGYSDRLAHRESL